MKILSPITENKDIIDKEYLDSCLENKQATLVSGTNIKTINNQSILGSGNLIISGGSDPYHYDENAGWYSFTGIKTLDGAYVSADGSDVPLVYLTMVLTTLRPDFSGLTTYLEYLLNNTTIPSSAIIDNTFNIYFENGSIAELSVAQNNDSYSVDNVKINGYASSYLPFSYVANIVSNQVNITTLYIGQQELVSGTNIKTINNQSLLGSGNIAISSSGGTPTDVQVNGTSITSNNVANLVTYTAYNSLSNKLATMNDLPIWIECNVNIKDNPTFTSWVTQNVLSVISNANSNSIPVFLKANLLYTYEGTDINVGTWYLVQAQNMDSDIIFYAVIGENGFFIIQFNAENVNSPESGISVPFMLTAEMIPHMPYIEDATSSDIVQKFNQLLAWMRLTNFIDNGEED